LILLGLTLLAYTASAQEGNNQVAIEFTKFNIVYKGIENPVTIVASDYAAEELSFSVTNGSVETTETPGRIIIKTSAANNSKLELKILANETVLRTIEYVVKTVPDPCFYLGNYRSGSSASIDDIISLPINALKAPIFYYKAEYSVLEFSIRITEGGIPVSYKISGNKISDNPEAAAAVRKGVKSGDNFNFMSFTIKTPSGIRPNVPGIVFTVR